MAVFGLYLCLTSHDYLVSKFAYTYFTNRDLKITTAAFKFNHKFPSKIFVPVTQKRY